MKKPGWSIFTATAFDVSLVPGTRCIHEGPHQLVGSAPRLDLDAVALPVTSSACEECVLRRSLEEEEEEESSGIGDG